MVKIEQEELNRRRDAIRVDVRHLVERYRAIFDWDVPDIDQRRADRLIIDEVRSALDHLQSELLGAS